MLTTVFRVEKKDGTGPYSTHKNPYLMDALYEHNNNPDTPASWSDVERHGEWATKSHRHGFLLMSDLEDWFSNCKAWFGKELFIKEYQVPSYKIYLGTKQVVFLVD